MKEHPIKTVVLSSLCKVFPEIEPLENDKLHFSCMQNEPLSFQVAYKLFSENAVTMPFYIKLETDLPISVYDEGFVPVLQTDDPPLNDRYRPGLFPDILMPKAVNSKLTVGCNPWSKVHFDGDDIQLHSVRDSWKAMWLTVNEDGKSVEPGEHNIHIMLYSRSSSQLVGECSITADIIGAELPKQRLIYTNWFHCDCLCDTYGVEMFSERFWEIFRSFASTAAKNGMNMILTPCFTPPLDTPIGGERMTAQLVGVEVVNKQYKFDFSLLGRYIDESLKCGIKYFEHSHLFTQWGAEHTPKIMATVNGKYKRIFGWETTAWGKKYREFLHAYIPALLEFLKSRKIDKKFLFHISDEPFPKMKESYCKSKAAVGDLLDGYMCGDALSHYEFYEDGTVKTPIVATDNIHEFYGRCDNLWAYYTGMQCSGGSSNRKLNCSSARNRMLGVHMYTYNIKGFLHWGYNFYYDMLSYGLFDPKTEPCNFNGAGGGTSYFVYPALNGTALQSIRQKVFYEAINDMRALQLSEKLIGRKATTELIEKHYGKVTFSTDSGGEDKLLRFREELNKTISSALKTRQSRETLR